MNERTLSALATPAALLVGPRWAWQGAADPGRYTLAFGPAGRLEVIADCNRGEGRFEVDGTRLHIGDLALTKKLCGRDAEERSFRAALAAVTGYRRAADVLELSTAEGRTLTFRAMP